MAVLRSLHCRLCAPRRLLIGSRKTLATVAAGTGYQDSSSKDTRDSPQASPGREWLMQFDGGSRGNPGMGASGAVLYAVDAGQLTEVWTSSRFLGAADVTCNQAEYQALIDGLRQAVKMRLTSLTVQGDSSLVVNQMLGQWKVNNARLLQLVGVAKRLLQRLPAASLEWIPRAQNSRADSLCNTAMDAGVSEVCWRVGEADQPYVPSLGTEPAHQVMVLPLLRATEPDAQLVLTRWREVPAGVEGDGGVGAQVQKGSLAPLTFDLGLLLVDPDQESSDGNSDSHRDSSDSSDNVLASEPDSEQLHRAALASGLSEFLGLRGLQGVVFSNETVWWGVAQSSSLTTCVVEVADVTATQASCAADAGRGGVEAGLHLVRLRGLDSHLLSVSEGQAWSVDPLLLRWVASGGALEIFWPLHRARFPAAPVPETLVAPRRRRVTIDAHSDPAVDINP